MDLFSVRNGWLAAGLALWAGSAAAGSYGTLPARINAFGMAAYPDAARSCPHLPASSYAPCLAQTDILAAAQARARASGKLILVVVGDQDCVWCVALARYLDGWSDAAIEPRSAGTAADAQALARYVAKNFVVAELNANSVDTERALRLGHLSASHIRELPGAFVISPRAVQRVDFARAELPKSGAFRGYRRLALIQLLRETINLSG